MLTSQFYSPSTIIVVDVDDQPPVNSSEKMGVTHVVNPIKEDPMAKILEITNGRGVDCFMEAVGMPAT